MAKFTRNWKIDSDYIGKLNKEELEFLRQFNDEYYRAYFRKNTPPLHALSEIVTDTDARSGAAVKKTRRKQLDDERNIARRDILSAHPDQILRSMYAQSQRNNYTQLTFEESQQSAEDAIIDAIDNDASY